MLLQTGTESLWSFIIKHVLDCHFWHAKASTGNPARSRGQTQQDLLSFGAPVVVQWLEEEIGDEAQLAELARQARTAFPDLDANQDVEWLNSGLTDQRLVILAARENGRLVGLAPFEVYPSRLQFGFGDLTLMSKKVRRYALEHHPLVADRTRENALADCFHALAERLSKNSVVFLRGVPEASAMNTLLVERNSPLRSNFHVVPHGPRYMRCRIRWEGNFDAYLNSLSKVTRKDLRRTLKKWPELLGNDTRLRRYQKPHEVEEFVRLACQISDRTYQAKLLGLGLSQNPADRNKIACAARKGMFLGHITFVGDEPVAFHYGFIHGQRFCMMDGGYDPRWAKAQLGILTFLLVLQDMEKHRDDVTMLDYMYGDSAYKTRTSNLLDPERNFYLVKRGISGSILAAAMRTNDQLSRNVGDFLKNLGAKDIVKRIMRRNMSRCVGFFAFFKAPPSAVTWAECAMLA